MDKDNCDDVDLSVDFSESNEFATCENISENIQCGESVSINSKHTKNLRDFIELYETLPELWNTTNPGYARKNKRDLALDKLLPVFRKIKSCANRVDVRRKINTLRSNYRKELKKIIDSKKSGKGSDEVYQPSSWVFYSLQFLDKYEKPVNLEIQQTDESCESDSRQNDVNVMKRPISVPHTASRSNIMSPPPPELNKRRMSTNSKQNELLQKACNYLDNSITTKNNIPAIAIAWGESLTQLDSRQRMFAEKAISDIIFEARQGNLHKNSVKINEEPWTVISPTGSSNSSTASHEAFIYENSSSQSSSDEQQPQSPISGFFTDFVPN